MTEEVVILGIGMHPWGKWEKNFLEYGRVAVQMALKDASLEWKDIQFIAAGNTRFGGYPGMIAGSSFARALGFSGIPVASCFGACATGGVAVNIARSQILAGMCDVALVVGAESAPKGFFGPPEGDRPHDPDWLRFRLLGATNPTYFALYAQRRVQIYGTTELDFAKVKVKNSQHGLNNPFARYRKKFALDEILNSPVVADPLRLLEICATSDGAAAMILCSRSFAKKNTNRPIKIAAVSTVTPKYPNNIIDLPNFATDSSYSTPPPALTFRRSIAWKAYEEAGIGPEDLDLAEVYDLSTGLELDWYEDIGLCKPGEAESLLNDGETTIGGKIPVNTSGGLSCFGEAIPAQAIAQVCELAWQLRGEAKERQVEGAKVGLSINQGLFGHGSCVILKK
jgi:acetyl-CoA acetyltransferase